MRISVKVQPRASKEEIVKLPDGSLKAYIRQAPADGKANHALMEMLADFYGVRRLEISIIAGKTSRNKIIEVKK